MRRALPLLLLIVTFASTAARAEEPAIARARRHYATGEARYREGKFSEALAEFEASLELVNRPSILLNIAQCHRKLGRKVEARSYYRRYLDEWQRQNPGIRSPYEEEVTEKIRVLDRELEVKGRAPATAPAATAPAPSLSRDLRLVPVAPPPARRVPLYKRWWLWTLVGAVVVGGAVTAGVLAGRDTWRPQARDGSFTPSDFAGGAR